MENRCCQMVLLMLCLTLLITGCANDDVQSGQSGTGSDASVSDALGPASIIDGTNDTSSATDSLMTDVPSQGIYIGGSVPYHELAFSVGDFTYAGYSVADGDHVSEVFQTVSETFPSAKNSYEAEGKWVYWPEIMYPQRIQTFFYRKLGTTVNTSAEVYYSVNDLEWAYNVPHTEISLQIMYDTDYLGEKIVEEYPFLDSPVIPEMNRDEVLEILGLNEIITDAELNNIDGDYCFDSQYGETHCRFGVSSYSPYGPTVTIEYSNISIRLGFSGDILFELECRSTFTEG